MGTISTEENSNSSMEIRMDLPPLFIGDLEIPLPIFQGGMSVGVSLAGLSSAVANEGGLGIIGTAGIGLLYPRMGEEYADANAIALKAEIAKARTMTDGLIGTNILMALTDYDSLINASLDAGADVILLGAGKFLMAPPTVDMERIRTSKTKIIVIVSSAKSVEVMFKFWNKRYNFVPDAVVVEGPMAGGHIGFTREDAADPNVRLESIIPEVVKIIANYEQQYNQRIPVIAAGGVYTGADIARYLALGARGVQMGTRFVATHECDASLEFKQAHLNAKKEDVVVIKSPVGLPGRAISNEYLDDVKNGLKTPKSCAWKCLRTCEWETTPYCIALALLSAQRGKLDRGFAFAGSNAWRSEKLVHVSELIQELKDGFSEAILPPQE